MKKYFFLLIIPFVFGCKKDLTGHWHAKMIDDKNFNVSIDILENNDSYIYNSLTFSPTKGEHFPDNNQINFPGQCGDLSFNYYSINNKLFLENALGVKLIATRFDSTCNRFEDYKSILPINLLKVKNKRALYKPKNTIKNENLNEYILFDSKNDTIRIEFFDRINSIEKIDEIIDYIETSISDTEIPLINYVLVPDKNVLISDLKTVIDSLNKNTRKRIFIQTLKTNPKDFNVFEYIKIDELDLNSKKSLSEIIN